ncbi:MAG: hypothetical protein Q9P01_17205 [Anaerolineae bacterium]|nr:hypothetical protein [Anaerolineae bacterium]
MVQKEKPFRYVWKSLQYAPFVVVRHYAKALMPKFLLKYAIQFYQQIRRRHSSATVSITSSWDDGHVLDLRVADMLDRYGLTGTFYIARDFLDERMSDSQLQDLAQRHEVGAHTANTPCSD